MATQKKQEMYSLNIFIFIFSPIKSGYQTKK